MKQELSEPFSYLKDKNEVCNVLVDEWEKSTQSFYAMLLELMDIDALVVKESKFFNPKQD